MAVQTAKRKARFRLLPPQYKPWFQPLYEPASGEIESLLFTLQGSLGAAVIFYILGYCKGKQRRDDRA
ncbi:cobalt transport protein CbiN [Salmonella enterica subsp. enterica serovar Typhimurium]|nr:cobalt transport protein CbiN [Salmonella enterica subsp. enterica serovar Typhimurium]